MLQGRSRQRRREAFIAEDDPGDASVDGFGNAGFTAGKEAPLEVIALDDDGGGISPSRRRWNSGRMSTSCARWRMATSAALGDRRSESRPSRGEELI